MNQLLKKLILACSLLTPLCAQAQTLAEAEASLSAYRRVAETGQETQLGYLSLYEAYQQYVAASKTAVAGTADHAKCKAGLLEIFPKLGEGAYFFTDCNNQTQAIRFAQAYIDLSLLYIVSEEHLTERPEYAMLAYFAAMNTYYAKSLEQAILYFQAYLSTTDTEHREMAFQGLTATYYELKRYDDVKYIASQASAKYPGNWNIVAMAVEACGATKDDNNLEVFLQKALAIRPTEAKLLLNQANMYERKQDYQNALALYKRLNNLIPNNLDFYCHLAFNAYNMGVVCLQQAGQQRKKKEEEELRQVAKGYFSQALPYLKDVLDNDPYAYNVARAVAMCHNVLGNTAALNEANQTLMAMRGATVKAGSQPTLQRSYVPSRNTEPVAEPEPVETFLSDVDKDIPEAGFKNERTYVVVFGNEDYKHHSKVNFAHNDAASFKTYCNKVLGIPADNIHLRKDATLTELREEVKFLTEITKMNPGELDIIFYYAGHGIPDVANGRAYLLPTDATGTDFESCYSLDKLYEQFDAMRARRVMVFLDACFSGATRASGMLFAERFVEYEPEEPTVQGNTIVFSATTGKQTAMSYDDQHHGFFTYYLLKNLQESKGQITLQELGKKLTKQVDNKAYTLKNKHQTPQVKAAVAAGTDWQNMRMIQQ